MGGLVRIDDTASRVFLPPSRIFDALRPDAEPLDWSILDLREAVSEEIDVVELDARVRADPRGLAVTFDELSTIGRQVRQVIDGLFVGCADRADRPSRADSDAAIVGAADMVVAAVDSSFWLVSATNEVLERLRTTFEHVTDQDPATCQLSAWGRD